MRTPEFWSPHKGGAYAEALGPLAWGYDVAAQVSRAFVAPRRAPVPVICVGSLVTGGAGKTPTAMALARLLLAQGLSPHFLTRGYGGSARGPLRVDPESDSARRVGDEPLLLARVAPTWLSHDRVKGASAAAKAGADVVVMDDGLQNPSLVKDLSFVVVDGGFGFGNGHLIPAGPLREPVQRGLRRADALVLLGADQVGIGGQLPHSAPPVIAAELVPDAEAYRLHERAVVAFAGIARPAKFFATLEALGCEIVGRYVFGDHHRYTPDEIMTIVEAAQERGAAPVTTEKDWVRLPEDAKPMIQTVKVSLEWQDPAAVAAILQPIISVAATVHG